jgi:hypothetical protein
LGVVLPKAAKGYQYSRLAGFELNEFDVERLLPSLFFLVITRGRRWAKSPNDPSRYRDFLNAVCTHPRVHGFDDEQGRKLMDLWLRAAVVRMSSVGLRRRGEQMEYLMPLTLLIHKSGLPPLLTRQRKADFFIYEALLAALDGERDRLSAAKFLGEAFRKTFGGGVVIDEAPTYDGRYDGVTPVDAETLLTLCFLDGLQPPALGKRSDDPEPATMRAAARGVGRDLLDYLLAYRNRLPTQALTGGLLALINFELFSYTLRLVSATDHLFRHSEIPQAMVQSEGGPSPEIYVDFTRERGGDSDDLARACVDRDLDRLRLFFSHAVTLRSVSRFAALNQPLQRRLSELQSDTPRYLFSLLQMRDEPAIQARAEAELELILEESTASVRSEGEQEEAKLVVQEALRRSSKPLDALVDVVVSVQQKGAVENYVKWFWSTGGLRKSYGLIAGNLRGKRNWRYAMSDDLLAALLRLALIDSQSRETGEVNLHKRLSLPAFLFFLEQRFGLLVERPPSIADDVRSRAAARRNLDALKRRLRQMGWFEALSDDFTAQYIRVPTY